MIKPQEGEVSKIVAIICVTLVVGVMLGVSITFMLFSNLADSIVSNILGSIQIENINFDLNETALVEAMNRTFGGLQ